MVIINSTSHIKIAENIYLGWENDFKNPSLQINVNFGIAFLTKKSIIDLIAGLTLLRDNVK